MSSNKRPAPSSSSSAPAPKRASSSSSSSSKPGLASIFGNKSERHPPLSNNPLTLTFKPKLEGTTKLATWNVNGLKSAGSKEKSYAFRKYCEAEKADVLVLTEVKMPGASTADELEWLTLMYKYRYWSAPGVKDGQVAILSKVEPVAPPKFGLPEWAESDKAQADSRCITLEFEKTFLVGTYVQNSGEGKQFMERKLKWNRDFKRYISELQKTKPVIWTGDFNAIHDMKVTGANNWVGGDWTGSSSPGAYPRIILRIPRSFNNISIRRSILPRVKTTEIRHEVHEHFPASSDHWPVNCVMEGTL
ncbi:hypothetical protein P7C70_g8434, partial [Phenoliferia sp. Uapishka_3]